MAGESRIGDYVIRYNAVHSLDLPADTTQAAGIARDSDNVVVIVNVQLPQAHQSVSTVAAQVSGSARDLFGNKRKLEFAAHREAGDIDYLAQTPVQNEQTLIFELKVIPEDGPTKTLQFQQTFYIR